MMKFFVLILLISYMVVMGCAHAPVASPKTLENDLGALLGSVRTHQADTRQVVSRIEQEWRFAPAPLESSVVHVLNTTEELLKIRPVPLDVVLKLYLLTVQWFVSGQLEELDVEIALRWATDTGRILPVTGRGDLFAIHIMRLNFTDIAAINPLAAATLAEQTCLSWRYAGHYDLCKALLRKINLATQNVFALQQLELESLLNEFVKNPQPAARLSLLKLHSMAKTSQNKQLAFWLLLTLAQANMVLGDATAAAKYATAYTAAANAESWPLPWERLYGDLVHISILRKKSRYSDASKSADRLSLQLEKEVHGSIEMRAWVELEKLLCLALQGLRDDAVRSAARLRSLLPSLPQLEFVNSYIDQIFWALDKRPGLAPAFIKQKNILGDQNFDIQNIEKISNQLRN